MTGPSDKWGNDPVYPALLRLEYDGSAFAGYQRQANAFTVQQALEEALTSLHGRPVPLLSSGRTDAGVHALGMPVQVLLPKAWTAEKLMFGLNRYLPEGAAVVRVQPTLLPFNPRHDVTRKRYDYLLVPGSGRRPLLHQRAWLMHAIPDENRCRQALASLAGSHDFRAFCTKRGDESTFVRHLLKTDLRIVSGQWRFRFEAPGFLYKMVRRLVGAVVETGLGKQQASDIPKAFNFPEQSPFKLTAPPDGLTLVEVRYPLRFFISEMRPFPPPWSRRKASHELD